MNLADKLEGVERAIRRRPLADNRRALIATAARSWLEQYGKHLDPLGYFAMLSASVALARELAAERAAGLR